MSLFHLVSPITQFLTSRIGGAQTPRQPFLSRRSSTLMVEPLEDRLCPSSLGTWETLASLPTGQAYFTAGVIAGRLHVVGHHPAIPGTTQEVYDSVSNSWSSAVADPTPRTLAAGGVFNDRLYVAGGWVNADSNNPTAALDVYNPDTDSWTVGASMLTPRGNAASAMIGGKLYVAGGTTSFFSASTNQLQIYDPQTNAWTFGAPMPTGREGGAAAGIGGKLYVVGGLERLGGGSANFLDSTALEIYDPATNTWTSGAPMPTGRDGITAGVINGKLYVAGGQSNQLSRQYTVVEVYDPDSDTWSTETSLPSPKIFAASGVIDDKLFMAGGLTTGGAFSSTLVALSLGSNQAPVAVIDDYGINEDGSLIVSAANGVLANDTDADGDNLMVAGIVAGPANGELTLNSDGSFTYIPVADFNGIDTFIYEITDGNGGTSTATVTITVLSAESQIGAIGQQVQDLDDSNELNRGRGNSLLAKLAAAQRSLDKGKNASAINQLNAFIHEIEAFIDAGLLADLLGNTLAAQAQRAIDSAG